MYSNIYQKKGFKCKAAWSLYAAVAVTFIFTLCKPSDRVQVDGSSTVYPIMEAVAEEFLKKEPDIRISVGVSGTGGGFKKFCLGETDMSNASRPIKSSEIKSCKSNGINYIELQAAYDGIAVVVNKKNTFAAQMTVSDLEKIFRYKNPAALWKEINSDWPGKKIQVYTPGQDSGTYDYFVEMILGTKARVRSDAVFSEDDNVLVTGIAGDTYSLGFFGLAYYVENKDKLNLVGIMNPKTKKIVKPSLQTVGDGSYAPLSRPLHLYINTKALQRPVLLRFAEFYMDSAAQLSKDVGYIPLPKSLYKKNIETLRRASAAKK